MDHSRESKAKSGRSMSRPPRTERMRVLRALAITLGLGSAVPHDAPSQPAPTPAAAPAPASVPAKDYFLFVASEGNDYISLIKFGAAGATVERKFRMGTNPTELVG